MKPNLSIGEFAIVKGGQRYLFRPSFIAMQNLAETPKDIDRAMREVFTTFKLWADGQRIRSFRLQLCADVLRAFCTTELPEHVTGWEDPEGAVGKWRMKQDSADPSDLIVLANHCIKWAFMGEPRRQPKPSKHGGIQYFDPQQFVGILRSWGHSTSDAWETTLVEFQREWESRNPPSKKEQAHIGQEELKALRDKARAANKILAEKRKTGELATPKRTQKR